MGCNCKKKQVAQPTQEEVKEIKVEETKEETKK